jgi:CubicO group peptidase (beta-lactamase class C family)
VFQQQVNKYRVIDSYQINKFAGPEVFNALVAKLRKYDRVIIGLHQPSLSQSAQYGITKRSLNFIEALAAKTNVVVVSFASPYSMRYFKGSKAKVIMVAHADGGLEQQAAAQVLFGGIPCNGKLPVGSPAFKAGTGAFSTKSRLSYSAEYPADERSKLWFARVDTLILKAIEDKAMPGCQIVMAYKGDVVFSKSYGYHTYSPSHKVVDTDLYDLASITKIAATINSTMLLTDSYQLQIDAPLSNFLQYTHDTDKANITLRDLLLHQSGLPPGLGFIDKTMIHGKRLSPKYYQRYLHDDFRTPVASRLFIRTSYVDSMIQRIVQTPLLSPEYRYSDLGIMLMQQVIQQITHQRLDSFVTEKFFAPMGLDLCYMPWRQRKEYRCPPTETDKYWRNQTIKGYVNDPTSALMGGVSGHAGLFGNANDLAKLLYMWTNKGYYGGKKYISPETLDLFTHCQDCAANRRGYGFDKPLTDGTGGPCSALASESSFGHSGFTGGLVWADPERELIYVFLTNRTFPKADNNLLVQQNIRTRVQSYFYKAMGY